MPAYTTRFLTMVQTWTKKRHYGILASPIPVSPTFDVFIFVFSIRV
ncbi:hypothetical protein ACU8KH_05036 [Lachancea thermotolerans]